MVESLTLSLGFCNRKYGIIWGVVERIHFWHYNHRSVHHFHWNPFVDCFDKWLANTDSKNPIDHRLTTNWPPIEPIVSKQGLIAFLFRDEYCAWIQCLTNVSQLTDVAILRSRDITFKTFPFNVSFNWRHSFSTSFTLNNNFIQSVFVLIHLFLNQIKIINEFNIFCLKLK